MSDENRSIRIQNETGVSFHTKVTDAESGQEIHGIKSIDVRFRVDECVVADVTFSLVETTIDAQPEFIMAHPDTGEWKAISGIRFKDGTEWQWLRDVTTMNSPAREYKRR